MIHCMLSWDWHERRYFNIFFLFFPSMFCISCCENLWRALGVKFEHGMFCPLVMGLLQLLPSAPPCPSSPGISSQCPPCNWRTPYFGSPSGGARVNLNKRSISGAEQAWAAVLTLFLCCCTKGETFPTGFHLQLAEVWKLFSNIWSCSLFIFLQVFIDTLEFWCLSTWKAIHFLCSCFSFHGIMVISTARMRLGMKCHVDTSNLILLQYHFPWIFKFLNIYIN